jgi:hypothetical protein
MEISLGKDKVKTGRKNRMVVTEMSRFVKTLEQVFKDTVLELMDEGPQFNVE